MQVLLLNGLHNKRAHREIFCGPISVPWGSEATREAARAFAKRSAGGAGCGSASSSSSVSSTFATSSNALAKSRRIFVSHSSVLSKPDSASPALPLS